MLREMAIASDAARSSTVNGMSGRAWRRSFQTTAARSIAAVVDGLASRILLQGRDMLRHAGIHGQAETALSSRIAPIRAPVADDFASEVHHHSGQRLTSCKRLSVCSATSAIMPAARSFASGMSAVMITRPRQAA